MPTGKTQSVSEAERHLVEAAQRDPAAFAQLYDANFHRVYAYIVRRVSDAQRAEDLTAQVFHNALASLGKFQPTGAPFSAWLLKIAANVISDFWRKQGREGRAPNPDEPDPDPDNRQHPDEDLERYVAVFQLVERLPDAQRHVIELRFVDQKSIRETAEELGRSEGAVKQLQLRAMETLRAAWEGRR